MAASAELVFVISDLGSGGAQRVLTTLANAWAEQGRRIGVITLADESSDFFRLHPAIQRIVIGGIRQSRNPLEAVWMNIRRILALRRRLRQCGAKIVVSFVGTTNLLTILASAGLGMRRIVSERNDPARQSLGRSWDWMRRRLYRYADKVTANSRGVLDTLAEFVPAGRLAYVPNPVAIPLEVMEDGARQPVILSVGRLHPQKAYDILIPAFAEASAGCEEWRVEILGEGPLLDSLKDLAEKQGVADRVIWRGRAESVLPFYQTTSIFVLASRHEGMPNAMLEAMACGLPVIVSDASPGPLEYVEDGVAGLVVPVENVHALANAMRRLMENADLRRRLGQNAKERVADCELSKAIQIWEQAIGI
jgi:GalNAc-alpha-(1->4)-GalNAc-alpha-(1->3)-diNAcBac-PP-undecaprenol alpha-1,4-N-acetyl-D-galactosaminyltransferase